jgi:hypothetical protein
MMKTTQVHKVELNYFKQTNVWNIIDDHELTFTEKKNWLMNCPRLQGDEKIDLLRNLIHNRLSLNNSDLKILEKAQITLNQSLTENSIILLIEIAVMTGKLHAENNKLTNIVKWNPTLGEFVYNDKIEID